MDTTLYLTPDFLAQSPFPPVQRERRHSTAVLSPQNGAGCSRLRGCMGMDAARAWVLLAVPLCGNGPCWGFAMLYWSWRAFLPHRARISSRLHNGSWDEELLPFLLVNWPQTTLITATHAQPWAAGCTVSAELCSRAPICCHSPA